MPQTKILLDESDIPTHWYNVVADMPNKPAPPLGPDGKPISPEALTAIFPMSLIEQEVSAERWIPIPEPVREAYRMLWVRLAPPTGAVQPIHDLPRFTAEDDPQLRKTTSGPYRVAASAPRIIENFLDMAHFGYVHEGLLGSRERPEIPLYEVEPTPWGVRATGCRAWQPRSSIHATGEAQVEYGYEVTAPYTAVLTKQPEAGLSAVDGHREAIAMFICPVGEESSVVWTRMALNDFTSPDARLIEFQDAIFGQDQPILESQRPKRLPLTPTAELHCAADRLSAAYRRYLKQSGITYGVIA